MTTALKITTQVVSSLNSGLASDLYIVANDVSANGGQLFTVNWSVYESESLETKVSAIFKNNKEIIQQSQVTLGEGVEASTTSILQALKDVLSSQYSWTIVEITD